MGASAWSMNIRVNLFCHRSGDESIADYGLLRHWKANHSHHKRALAKLEVNRKRCDERLE